jgi:ribosomal protein S12 methylthiotransferase
LLDFIEEMRFERLGTFCYSQEEGSRAAKMPAQVPAKVKNRRYREAMKLQQKIAAELAAAKLGAEMRVLVDQPRVARSQYDAPEVDCRVILNRSAPVGEFVDVRVTGSQVYDVLAVI